ncbi:MAG: hypothetical protein R2764_16455 [Bacteroidales bacterium]
MKRRLSLLILLILSLMMVCGQYLPNPSFEGPFPLENNPPQPWLNCSGSPDTQPLCWDVPTPPSDGSSYVGFAWISTWIERIWSELSTPLSSDTCYLFQIDLAFYPEINHTIGLQQTYPIQLRVYQSESYCIEDILLWESPNIGHPNWVTYEFTLTPVSNIEGLLFRSYSSETNPPPFPQNLGYVLADNIRITPPPYLDLGNDTSLCINDSLILLANSGFDEYLWTDGSSDTTFLVTEPGTYWVEALTEWGCNVVDSIHIEFSPWVDLGNDTTICIGDTLVYSVASGYSDYIWHDGSSDTSFMVWEPGEYLIWVSVNDNNCSNSDTVFVSIINDSTEVNLGNDTILCQGSLYELNPGSFDEYIWQDGSTDSVFMVTEPGMYWLTIYGDCGLGTDTVIIDFFPPFEIDLGPDTSFCEGNPFILDPGSGFNSYLWQDSSINQIYSVNSSGLYWVNVLDGNSCMAVDSISVIVDPQPEADLGSDTAFCENEQELILDAGVGYAYLWQNGDTTQYFTVNQSGNYHVTVNNGCGNDTDTIHVDVNPVPDLYLVTIPRFVDPAATFYIPMVNTQVISGRTTAQHLFTPLPPPVVIG